jgi:hypothetical protein
MNRLAFFEENIKLLNQWQHASPKLFDQQEEGDCVNYWNIFYKCVTSVEVVFLSFILTW